MHGNKSSIMNKTKGWGKQRLYSHQVAGTTTFNPLGGFAKIPTVDLTHGVHRSIQLGLILLYWCRIRRSKWGDAYRKNSGKGWPRRKMAVTVGTPKRKEKTNRGNLHVARRRTKETDRRWPATSPEHCKVMTCRRKYCNCRELHTGEEGAMPDCFCSR